jgi:Mg-chelatase subunit ChlD
VRIDRLGTVTPSSELWVEYLDGDGSRRRVDVTPASVEVFAPTIHTIHLPVILRHECEKVTARADVVLVVDISSSMTGAKFDQARAAARTFVSLLELPGDQAAVVGYSQQAHLLQALTDDRAALERALDSLAVDAGTRIDRGLATAATELQGPDHRPANRPVIVLMTDGIQIEEPETALAWAEYAWALGVTVYTVALGVDADQAMLLQIAHEPARAYYAPAPDDLGRIYTEVAGAVRCR